MAKRIDILRFCNINLKSPLNDEDFWAERLRYIFDYSYSPSLLLIRKLIIPKMFENSCIPKELRGNKQTEKLNNYLKEHPSDKYIINIKSIKSDTDCIKLLKETLSQITQDAKVSNDTFCLKYN